MENAALPVVGVDGQRGQLDVGFLEIAAGLCARQVIGQLEQLATEFEVAAVVAKVAPFAHQAEPRSILLPHAPKRLEDHSWVATLLLRFRVGVVNERIRPLDRHNPCGVVGPALASGRVQEPLKKNKKNKKKKQKKNQKKKQNTPLKYH